MPSYRVTFEPEAIDHLNALHDYIAADGSPEIARRYTDGIVDRCERLDMFPARGTPRDDLREGLRTIVHRRSTTIAYMVYPGRVSILGVFHRGQDIKARFRRGD